ncbi:MAG: ATP-grasp domain-containing protein, partial [Acidothermales bacterium]|nr:ATP-grasp domain-containing protein [Acidothermales bacterium]
MRAAAFVAPYLLEATARFIEAAARLPDVRLGLVTQEPVDRLPPQLRSSLAAHWRVDDALDPSQVAAAVRGLERQLGPVERLVAALEQLQVPLAEVREALHIPGMDVETAHNFRDKGRMKDVLRAAGVPCARHALVTDVAGAVAFLDDVGYPVVAKPPAGAGAKSTFRLDGPNELREWLAIAPPATGRPMLLEEFLTGEEHSLESVVVDGKPVWHSVSRYLPTPLEVLRNPWMQWVVLLPRQVEGLEYDEIRDVGSAALQALGLRTGLTHMEWFRRPDGSAAVSEVGARPPGAQIMSLLSYAYEVDFPTTWARLMILDDFTPPERRWSVGAAYLRGQGSGRVRAVYGVPELHREVGHLVVEA